MTSLAVGIVATGSYLPKEEITNEEIAVRVGVTAEWIERKTEITARRYAAPDEATSDLALRAAWDALANGGISVDRIGYLIVCTSTGDHPQPPTSYLVQDGLGAYGAACFDINVVCSGFVFGLALARALLAVDPLTYVLVIGADVYSRILDFTDRRTAVLFADGAGAAVVGAVPESYGFVDIDLVSRGDAHRLIKVDAGGSRRPASVETVAGPRYRVDVIKMLQGDFYDREEPAALKAMREVVTAAENDPSHLWYPYLGTMRAPAMAPVF